MIFLLNFDASASIFRYILITINFGSRKSDISEKAYFPAAPFTNATTNYQGLFSAGHVTYL